MPGTVCGPSRELRPCRYRRLHTWCSLDMPITASASTAKELNEFTGRTGVGADGQDVRDRYHAGPPGELLRPRRMSPSRRTFVGKIGDSWGAATRLLTQERLWQRAARVGSEGWAPARVVAMSSACGAGESQRVLGVLLLDERERQRGRKRVPRTDRINGKFTSGGATSASSLPALCKAAVPRLP